MTDTNKLEKGLLDSFEKIFELGVAEDFVSDDATSRSIFTKKNKALATFAAKELLVVCGLPFLNHVADSLPKTGFLFGAKVHEGQRVGPDEVVATLSGNALDLLGYERLLLNLLQHLSGVATLTRAYVDALEGSSIQLLDTRKTLPGYRQLQKYAVRVGGAKNHRMNLSDMVLVKDNHIKMAGGVKRALERVRSSLKDPKPFVEVECNTLDEVRDIPFDFVDRVMLDNMDDATLAKAIDVVQGRAEVEVSGSINLERLRSLKQHPIDYISAGAITHSARAVDISMDIDFLGGKP